MAVNDEFKQRDRLTPRDRLQGYRTRAEGIGWLPIIIGLLAVALVAWWAFGDRMSNTGDNTRTTAPVTGSPNTGTNTPSNPTTTPKQP